MGSSIVLLPLLISFSYALDVIAMLSTEGTVHSILQQHPLSLQDTLLINCSCLVRQSYLHFELKITLSSISPEGTTFFHPSAEVLHKPNILQEHLNRDKFLLSFSVLILMHGFFGSRKIYYRQLQSSWC